MNLYFHGFWRMDWGFANPNKTAALIVTLMFAAWGLGFVWQKGFWLSLAFFGTLGVLLIHTFSRGGAAALVAGSALLLWLAPRPWPKARVVGGIICIWAILGATLYLQANQRFGRGIDDRSIANRIEIWKTVPAMVAAAPGGWGIGNAARSYENWYQSLDRGECYLNLVSTHLTWFVEFSWWQRILYCFGWFAVGLLCWPPKGRESCRWFVVPLSIWISFFVSAIFSHVAESIWLWVLPGIALVAVLGVRFRFRIWPRPLASSGALAAAASVVVAITCWGMMQPGLHVHGSRHLVKIGDGEVRAWVVTNTGTLGDHYGKALRRYLEDRPLTIPVGIVDSLENLPPGHQELVVVSGDLSDSERKLLHSEGRLLLLDPTFFPQEAGITSAKVVGVLFGEFSQSPSIQAWQSVAHVKTLEGVGDFIASWPECVFNSGAISMSE